MKGKDSMGLPTHLRDPKGPCRACGRQSVLVLSQDRFYHEDGSANVECWRTLLRGDCGSGTQWDTVLVTDRETGAPSLRLVSELEVSNRYE